MKNGRNRGRGRSSIGTFLLGAAAACIASGLSGCATMQRQAAADMSLQEDLLIFREDLARIEGRVETTEMEHRRLLREIEQLRDTVSRAGGETGGFLRRLDELERGLSNMSAARERDRVAIIDQLSSRVADMIAAAADNRRSRAVATGYEHVVQAGETLSQIAAAYKVRPSVIIDANDLKDPDFLRQGQRLFIPSK